MAGLADQIAYFKNQLKEIMKTMEKEIPENIKEKVIEAIVKEMPDAELMDDLDVVQPSVSAPIGGKNAAK